MKDILKCFPVSLRLIFTDPVNLILALIPTIIALSIYLFLIFSIFENLELFVSFFKNYSYTADSATIFGKILIVILMIFLFFLFNWTFILMVGIVSAPFNSLISSRIEQKLLSEVELDENRRHAISLVKKRMIETFWDEIKKVFYLSIIGFLAFLINLIPILYPIAAFILSILFAVQFIDYSWSRHNLSFKDCMKDLSRNVFPYFVSGFVFLALISIPLINTFIPAIATSYFTTLWLYRQKKISH